MELEERERIERGTRRLFEAGDYDGAATFALKGYGPEIYGFLVAFHRSEQAAADVFASFSESLWRSLPRFGWQSTLRTWAYAIARYASLRYRRDGRRERGNEPLSAHESRIVDAIRSETAAHLRTENKSALALLRESLPREDQALLILRVDKGLAWDELVQVLHDDPERPLDAATRKREAARLRKRFQTLKEKLAALMRERGLGGPPRET